MTSNAALQRSAGCSGGQGGAHGHARSACHRFAAAVLGRGHQIRRRLLEADKTYEAIIRLGVATTTGDAEGEPYSEARRRRAAWSGCRRSWLRSQARSTRCHRCSARIKHQGRPLYSYARAGQSVERTTRRVTVHDLELLSTSGTGVSDPGSVQQGNLYPDPGPRHRSALGVRGASQGAAAHRDRRLEDRGGR